MTDIGTGRAAVAAAASRSPAAVHGRRTVSGTGALIGFFFFAASLTPSLIPRDALMQGLLGGSLFAIGYGIGVAAIGLWFWLELPRPPRRWADRAALAAATLGFALAFAALLQAADWQDSIRSLMGLEPLQSAHRLEVAGLAAGTGAVLFALAYLFKIVFRIVARQLDRFVPRRVAAAVGLAVALFLFTTAVDGILMQQVLRAADAFYAQLDALMEPGTAAPVEDWKSGSAPSLVAWDDLGRAGREFVDATPTAAAIAEFWGEEARQPLRVYVGLNAADTAEERAALALAELVRVGGFDRSVLVVAIPTGTGFMEQAAIGTLEYLHRGDVATVAVQYSYLQSPFSLLFEPGYGEHSARALLRAVYDRWSALPEDTRPDLYLQGLSLGALSSEQSVRLHEVLGDPPDGALWSGPPFPSPLHRAATEERDPGSPEWLPVFEDGAFIRFTNQTDHLDLAGATWGPMRIVYLQYASDPIVFFDPAILWRKPDWLKPPRGPDVSQEVRWIPIVTALQLLADMAVSTNTPLGHGHQYAPSNYIDAWVAVTAPDVTADEVARLKRRFGG